MKDGIYFDLPEDEYHALHRLSSSGIQNMLVSPATFWARSWMNPARNASDKKYQTIGRAYHCARLEPDRFAETYCREFTKDDLEEGALTTATDIGNALADLGHPKTKAGESVLEKSLRLRAAGYTGQIWHIEQDKWQTATANQTPIPSDVMDDIERDAARLRSNPEIARMIESGAAEVSVLWTDVETGIPMKCRFDYLKPDRFVDLKSFDNSRGKAVDRAVSDAFRYNRVYVQAALYWQAAELIRAGKVDPVNGTPEHKELIGAVRRNVAPMEAWYIFFEKGGVPNIIAYQFLTHHLHPSLAMAAPDEDAAEEALRKYGNETRIFERGKLEIASAQRAFNFNCEVFGNDPWVPVQPLRQINDDSFNQYWLDGEAQ